MVTSMKVISNWYLMLNHVKILYIEQEQQQQQQQTKQNKTKIQSVFTLESEFYHVSSQYLLKFFTDNS